MGEPDDAIALARIVRWYRVANLQYLPRDPENKGRILDFAEPPRDPDDIRRLLDFSDPARPLDSKAFLALVAWFFENWFEGPVRGALEWRVDELLALADVLVAARETELPGTLKLSAGLEQTTVGPVFDWDVELSMMRPSLNYFTNGGWAATGTMPASEIAESVAGLGDDDARRHLRRLLLKACGYVDRVVEGEGGEQGESFEEVEADFRDARGYGDLKVGVAEVVIDHIRPLQENYHRLMNDPSELDRVLAQGAQQAAAVSNPKVDAMKEIMGLIVPK